jgi:uncharacterized integral membrane protein
MNPLQRKRLSYDFAFIYGILILAIGLLTFIIWNDSKNNDNLDFITRKQEHQLLLVGAIIVLIVFVLKPKLYYTESDIYIKRLFQKEEKIPFTNIKSVFTNPLTLRKGRADITIAYSNEINEVGSIKINTYHSSSETKEFFVLVKKNNPKVEIL